MIDKPKIMSVSKAKKKAWSVFSKWVRWSKANALGMVKCVTCPAVLPAEVMQAGHFNPGRKNAILYDERGVNPQCYACNIIFKGRPREYDAWMRETHGAQIVDELDQLAKTTVQMKVADHMEVYQEYANRLDRLGVKYK